MKKLLLIPVILLLVIPVSVEADNWNGVAIQDTLSAILAHLDQHDHGRHWLMSKKALQTGSSKADSLALSFYDFDLTADADSTFGTPVQLLGSSDTPVVSGFTLFDVHEVVITAVNSDTLYKLRLAWGASSEIGVAANDYTDLWIWGDTTNPQSVSNSGLEVQIPSLAAGTLLWASIANAAGGQTMSMKFTLLEHN